MNVQVHVYRDYGNARHPLVLEKELYDIGWKPLITEVNAHNNLFVAGKVDYLLRVFCPWEGDELYIPKG